MAATATRKSNHPSDAQIISRLRRASGGRTAAQLGTTAAHLRGVEGVVEVGRQRKMVRGKAVAGRPAVLFGLADSASEESAEASE